MAMEAMVSAPMTSTMFWNFFVSMVAISFVFWISNSFWSWMNLFSASLACVSRSSSDCYKFNQPEWINTTHTHLLLAVKLLWVDREAGKKTHRGLGAKAEPTKM